MTNPNKLSLREIAFREKQRKSTIPHSLELKVRAPPISRRIVQFSGFPTLELIDLTLYPGIAYYVNTVLQPDEKYKDSVENVLFNLFLKTTGCFCQKGEYTRDERMHVKSQVSQFSDDINTLEVRTLTPLEALSGKRHTNNLTKFKKTQVYTPKSIQELLASEIYTGIPEWDLILLHDLENIMPTGYEAEKFASTMIGDKYEAQIKALVANLEGEIDETEFTPAIEEELGLLTDEFRSMTLSECQERFDALNNRTPTPSNAYKTTLRFMLEAKKIMTQADEETKQIIATLPNERGLVYGFSKKLKTNGIIIVGSAIKEEIDGLKRVKTYQKVTVYQKNN